VTREWNNASKSECFLFVCSRNRKERDKRQRKLSTCAHLICFDQSGTKAVLVVLINAIC